MKSEVRNKQKTTRRRDGRVRVTSQGQISIPRQVMREAGIEPGDQLQASTDSEGRVVLEPVVDPLLELIAAVPPGLFAGVGEQVRRMRDEEWER